MPQVMKDFNTIGLYYSSQILKKTIVMRGQKITNLEKISLKINNEVSQLWFHKYYSITIVKQSLTAW